MGSLTNRKPQGEAWHKSEAESSSKLVRLSETPAEQATDLARRSGELDHADQALYAAEHQRTMIAQLLHDDAIPTLLAAAQDLRDARAALPEGAASALEAIKRATAAVALGLNHLRGTAIDLHPAAPVGLALRESVQALAKQAAERGRFRCDVRVDRDAAVVDASAALTIIRELLANVAKHAHAGSASVEVAPAPGGRVAIAVADDGVGLSRARLRQAVTEGHIGLSLAAARVKELGGDLVIERNTARGTKITVDLPALSR
jgi:two-component system NarL family sensor kinase